MSYDRKTISFKIYEKLIVVRVIDIYLFYKNLFLLILLKIKLLDGKNIYFHKPIIISLNRNKFILILIIDIYFLGNNLFVKYKIFIWNMLKTFYSAVNQSLIDETHLGGRSVSEIEYSSKHKRSLSLNITSIDWPLLRFVTLTLVRTEVSYVRLS